MREFGFLSALKLRNDAIRQHLAEFNTPLVKGVDVQGKKLRFLRRIPIDPMTGKNEWGMRSTQDDPTSDSWGGQNVFDVFSKSDGTGLDGSKYKDW